jgi:hypothetical protein
MKLIQGHYHNRIYLPWSSHGTRCLHLEWLQCKRIQELQEFEVVPFIDQAKYIRVYLPNRVYIKTHQTKFSQSIILNPNQWQNENGFKI